MRRLRDIRTLLLARPRLAAVLACASLLLCWVSGGAVWFCDWRFVRALQLEDFNTARAVLVGGTRDWNDILARLDAIGDPRLYDRALDALVIWDYHFSGTREEDSAALAGLLARGVRPAYRHVEAAAQADDTQTVVLLLDHGAPARGAANQHNALSFAAANGDDQLALALIEKGADVNAVCNDASAPDEDPPASWRPLYVAASKGNVEVVRVLLEHGADPLLNEDSRGTVWAVVREEAKDGTSEQRPERFLAAVRLIRAAVEKRLGYHLVD